MRSRTLAVIMTTLCLIGVKTPAGAQSTAAPAAAANSQQQPPRPATNRARAPQVPAPARKQAAQNRIPLQDVPERELRQRVNAWVVGVAAGKLEGAPIRLVEEMSRVFDDGDDMQVLPIITRGPSYNVHALLYLRGIDLAVINGDVLDYFAKKQNIANIHNRINYITQLFNSEVHILARPEIKSLKDLAGKAVNFNTKGTSAAFTGPVIFDRLGIKIKKTFVPHPVAMNDMKKSDKYAAVVFVTAKPVRPLVKKKWPEGFRLLSVPYNDKVADYFLPSVLNAKDYPDLIPQGSDIQTIAVPTVLAAFNWPRNSARQKKVARFVDYLFERFDRLQKPPYHPKWREINLAVKIPGWQRLPIVQQKLDQRKLAARSANKAIDRAAIRAEAARAAPNDPERQDELFNEFLRWYQQRHAQR